MEKGLILDGQITASSVYSTYRPATGRLNFGGWSPLTSENINSWFQVDFETFATVTSIFTQGHQSSSYWVTTFIVSFSNDGRNFQDYLEFGKPKVSKPIQQLLYSLPNHVEIPTYRKCFYHVVHTYNLAQNIF